MKQIRDLESVTLTRTYVVGTMLDAFAAELNARHMLIKAGNTLAWSAGNGCTPIRETLSAIKSMIALAEAELRDIENNNPAA